MRKLSKKLLLSILSVALVFIALGTTTFAWFSMNTTVKADNMRVTIKADKGILINETDEKAATTWDDVATTNQDASIALRATSTANTGTWYTASSKKSSSSASATAGHVSDDIIGGAYTTLSSLLTQTVAASAGANAKQEIFYKDSNNDTTYQNGEGYYVKYTYYIKSSAEAISCGLAANNNNLNIKTVTATGTSVSTELDKALRVAVVINNKAYIYAPVSGATTSYYVNASSTATTVLSGAQPTSVTNIPEKTADNGIPVYIFLWFEGEDANLNTDNITATLDNLVVSVEFELVTNAAAATDNGIALS